MSSPDRQYRRYRRTGDPQALAAVFDALAPELRRVAGHLLRDDAAADDTVQDTFLALIDDAARFDETRAVAPWAVGILVNRCRRVRRLRQTAAERTRNATPDPEPADLRPDPAGSAAAREFAARLDDAVRRVPQPYRSAVELLLQEDLPPAAIARRLGRRPNTVRSQLRRGLEHLRNALPVGTAPAMVGLGTAPGSGLDAIRRAVLDHATRAPSAPIPGGPAPAGLGTPARWWAALAVAILLAVPLARLLVDPAPTGTPRVETATTATDLAPQPDRDPDSAPRTPPPKVAARSSRPDLEVPPPGHVRLIGRLLDQAAGDAPLVGAELHLESRGADDYATLHPASAASLDLRTRSDATGHFQLDFVPPHIEQVELTIAAAGRPTLTAEWSAPRSLPAFDPSSSLVPGRVCDLGRLTVPAGVRIEGLVRDAEGRPLRGVAVMLHGTGSRGSRVVATPTPLQQQVRLLNHWLASSDRDGRVVFDGVFTDDGGVALGLADGRYAASGTPQRLALDGPRRFELTVAARPRLEGTLVDEHGAALVGVRLVARRADGTVVAQATTVGRQGAFTLLGPPGPAPEVVLVPGMPTRIEPLWSDQPVRLDGSRLRLVGRHRAEDAAARPPVRIRVLDDRSGAPIERFAWRVGRDPSYAGLPGEADDWQGSGSRGLEQVEGGTLEVPGISTGHRALWITTPLSDHQPSGAIRFRHDAPHSEVTVRLTPSRPLRIRLALPSTDARLEGNWVEILRGAPEEPIPAGLVAEAFRVAAEAPHARLDAGFTDAHGEVTLQVPTDRSRFAVRVTCPGLGQERRLCDTTDGAVVEFAWSPAEAPRLALQDAESMARYAPRLQALRSRGGAPQLQTLSADPEGRFAVAALDPGTWQLRLVAALPGHDGVTRPAVLEPMLLELQLPLGSDAPDPLLLPTNAVRPARIEGRVLVDGEPPPPGSRIGLSARFPTGHPLGGSNLPQWRVGAALDATGAFTADAVPPGSYVVELFAGDGLGAMEVDDVVRPVAAGADLSWTCLLGGPQVNLLVVDDQGQPVARRVLALHVDQATMPQLVVTDAEGRLVWRHRTPARLRVVDPETGAASPTEHVDPIRADAHTLRLGPRTR